MKIITSWWTLMDYAHKEGQAKLHGTPEEYAKAKADHQAYREICMKADEMLPPVRLS